MAETAKVDNVFQNEADVADSETEENEVPSGTDNNGHIQNGRCDPEKNGTFVDVVVANNNSHITDAEACGFRRYSRKDAAIPTSPVAPDGGWGWVVVVAAFFLYLILGGIWFSFSVLYRVYAEHFNASMATVGMIASTEALVLHFTGAACSGFVEMFGARLVAVVGLVISSMSVFCASFSQTITMLYVTYGFTGFGCGLTFLPVVVTVQQYFEKKRYLATGISLTGFSCSTFLLPPLCDVLYEYYGWRGTLILISALYIQGVPFAMLLRPLSPPRPIGRLRHLSRQSSISEATTKWCFKCSAISGKLFRKIFDFSVFRDPRFTLYGIASFCFNMGYIAFFMHYINRAVYLGVDERSATLLPSIYGVCNGIFRVMAGFIANIPNVNRVLMYGSFILLGGITACVTTLTYNFTTLGIAAGVFGISVGGVISLQHSVLVDLLGVEMIARSAGFLQIFLGISGAITTPFAGWIYDMTGNYSIPYFLTGAIMILGSLIILVVALLARPGAEEVCSEGMDMDSEADDVFSPGTINSMRDSNRRRRRTDSSSPSRKYRDRADSTASALSIMN